MRLLITDARVRGRLPRRGLPRSPLVRTLVEARVAQGLTLHVLAARSGYSYNTLQKWESEITTPSLHAFRDWASALGYEVALITSSGE